LKKDSTFKKGQVAARRGWIIGGLLYVEEEEEEEEEEEVEDDQYTYVSIHIINL
jgi:hypothetical protein